MCNFFVYSQQWIHVCLGFHPDPGRPNPISYSVHPTVTLSPSIHYAPYYLAISHHCPVAVTQIILRISACQWALYSSHHSLEALTEFLVPQFLVFHPKRKWHWISSIITTEANTLKPMKKNTQNYSDHLQLLVDSLARWICWTYWLCRQLELMLPVSMQRTIQPCPSNLSRLDPKGPISGNEKN